MQITVADVRDGACSSSTLKEAASWGKVDTVAEQMVYAEATMALPLLASYAYHRGSWKKRKKWRFAGLYGLSSCPAGSTDRHGAGAAAPASRFGGPNGAVPFRNIPRKASMKTFQDL